MAKYMKNRILIEKCHQLVALKLTIRMVIWSMLAEKSASEQKLRPYREAFDGTALVVRVPFYKQKADYVEFCERTVEGLLKQRAGLDSAQDLIHTVGLKISDYRSGDPPRIDLTGRPLIFGRCYDRENHTGLNTFLVGRYEKAFARALSRLVPDKAKRLDDIYVQFTYRAHDQRPGEPDILLSQLKRKRGTGELTNEWDDANEARLKREMQWCYQQAIDPARSQTERCEHALEFYYLFSHDMPYESGSAMGGHLMLAYLFARAGVQLPAIKEGRDINIEALTSDKEHFLAEMKPGKLFDMTANRQSVRLWQNKEKAKLNAKQPLISTRDIVSLVFDTRDGKTIISNHDKWLLKDMLDHPEKEPQSIENPFPNFIEFRKGERGEEVLLHTAHNFIDHAVWADIGHQPTIDAIPTITASLYETWLPKPMERRKEVAYFRQ